MKKTGGFIFNTSVAKLTDFDNDKWSKSVLKMNFRPNKYNGYEAQKVLIIVDWHDCMIFGLSAVCINTKSPRISTI